MNGPASANSRPYGPSPADPALGPVLLDLVRHPLRNLVAGWNWKAGAISACLRALIFLVTNLKAGHHSAYRAAVVEALFAIVISGFSGALTERLRRTQPIWATALFVWLGIPVIMVALQAAVHHLAGTPHMRTGLIASFVLAGFGAGFAWFAQRRGLLLSGAERQGSAVDDLRALPGCVLDFFLALPRALRS